MICQNRSFLQVYVEFLTCQRGLPQVVRLAYTTNSSHTSNQLIHSHTHTNNHKPIQTHLHTFTHTHTPTYTHMHPLASTHTHTHPHTLTCIHSHAHTSLFSKFLSEHFFHFYPLFQLSEIILKPFSPILIPLIFV